MNKRIEELVEQSYEMKPYMVADPETFEIVQKIGYDGQPMFHRDFNREKFAELIVRDCVQMFADEGYDESVDMLIEHWDIDPRKLRS